MITAIKALLSSKKFWSAILGSVVATVCDQLGVSQDVVFGVLGLFGIQIAGQGLADAGKEKTKLKVAAAKEQLQAETEGKSPAERAAALADAGG